MARFRETPTMMNVVEPPRDGEFFFEDGWGDERNEPAAGGLWSRRAGWLFGSALALVAVVASVFLGS